MNRTFVLKPLSGQKTTPTHKHRNSYRNLLESVGGERTFRLNFRVDLRGRASRGLAGSRVPRLCLTHSKIRWRATSDPKRWSTPSKLLALLP